MTETYVFEMVMTSYFYNNPEKNIFLKKTYTKANANGFSLKKRLSSPDSKKNPAFYSMGFQRLELFLYLLNSSVDLVI